MINLELPVLLWTTHGGENVLCYCHLSDLDGQLLATPYLPSPEVVPLLRRSIPLDPHKLVEAPSQGSERRMYCYSETVPLG